MPQPRFNVKTIEGRQSAVKFAEAMAAALPFDKRNEWLTGRGWIDLGKLQARRMYLHPDDTTITPVNQTKAVLEECWRIMESKGIIFRP